MEPRGGGGVHNCLCSTKQLSLTLEKKERREKDRAQERGKYQNIGKSNKEMVRGKYKSPSQSYLVLGRSG